MFECVRRTYLQQQKNDRKRHFVVSFEMVPSLRKCHFTWFNIHDECEMVKQLTNQPIEWWNKYNGNTVVRQKIDVIVFKSIVLDEWWRMRNKPLCMCRTDQISHSIFATICLVYLHTCAKLVRRHALTHPSDILYESECILLFLVTATRHRNPCKQSKDKRPTTTINEKMQVAYFSIMLACSFDHTAQSVHMSLHSLTIVPRICISFHNFSTYVNRILRFPIRTWCGKNRRRILFIVICIRCPHNSLIHWKPRWTTAIW